MTSSFNHILVLIVFIIYQGAAQALPIGFGYNQGELEFMELKSDHFTVYHDKRAPEDAKLALKSLEAAKPFLETWFDVKRKSPLIVNMSAASDNASFANFITDSIELQTVGQGGRDLAWHEFTHSMMYQHLDNWFGPAGAILHLPWMEAWFLEGLAETVSVSLGSDEQAGVERYHALTGQWPSWDRIHSLYTSGPFNYRGYAASGAFVSWILRTHDADKLPGMLKEFRSKSMPWYWPWALVPFNGFLPMDQALIYLTGKDGKTLYEQYKKEAEAFWKSKAKAPLLASSLLADNLARNPWAWEFHDQKLIKKSPGDKVVGVQETSTKNARAWIGAYNPKANKQGYTINFAEQGAPIRRIKRALTWVEGPWISYHDVWWIETNLETSQLCKAPRKKFSSDSVKCAIKTSMPEHLRVLGRKQDPGSLDTSVLWLAKDRETLAGDRHQILEIQLATGVDRVVQQSMGGRPVSMAFAGDSRWLLVGGLASRYVMKLDDGDGCLGMVSISDFPVRIVGSDQTLPTVVLYTSDGYGAAPLNAVQFPVEPCHPVARRSSPMLEAMRAKSPLGFKDALMASNPWEEKTPTTLPPKLEAEEGQARGSDAPDAVSRPARWRGRPIFVFPWIGADDALGPQLGIISVPLMDEMQNETVRYTALLGIYSRFPYQDVTITTNRFIPTWSLTAFRAQTYSGRYRDVETGELYSRYHDELGAHVDGSYDMNWRYTAISFNGGLKTSVLKPYIGPSNRNGRLNESYAGVLLSGTNGRKLFANTSVKTRMASPGVNKNFHYDVVGVAATTGVLIHKGKLELGIDTSRTRGPRRRDLQEMYSPLKTLIPGSGGGLNQNSGVLFVDNGLFSQRFGENQARARILATHPIIQDIDKFAGLVYIDHLDLSGFLNYGTAWWGEDLPKRSDFIAAQGYSADLFLDNKGVNFNVGLGLGQVLGSPWQPYWTFGFDALF